MQNKGWQSPTDILQSYRNLEKFAGGSKSLVELPGPDAPPEKVAEFYAKLGRPESPEKYGIQAPEGADPEVVGWFKSTAHELGLSDKQAQALFTKYNEMAGGRLQAMEEQSKAQSEKAIADLRREWGQGYEAQIDMGRRAVAALGLNEQKLSEYEAKLSTGEMLKLFATLGSKMGEPAFAGDRDGASGFGLTPAAAKQQVDELKMDKQFMDAYMKGDPGAVSKMKRLMEAAYAGA